MRLLRRHAPRLNNLRACHEAIDTTCGRQANELPRAPVTKKTDRGSSAESNGDGGAVCSVPAVTAGPSRWCLPSSKSTPTPPKSIPEGTPKVPIWTRLPACNAASRAPLLTFTVAYGEIQAIGSWVRQIEASVGKSRQVGGDGKS